MPFLSELDPRGKVKGSRDPLGFEVVWSHLGRRIIRNFTTITSSFEAFATGMIGHYLANKYAGNSRNEKDVVDYFLKFEQLSAYSLCHVSFEQDLESPPILGITRVKKRYHEGEIQINTEPQWQILANQSASGILGLYSTALRQTGFLKPTEYKLTDTGMSVVEDCWYPRLKNQEAQIRDLVSNGGIYRPFDKHSELASVLTSAIKVIDPPLLERFYRPLAKGGINGQRNLQARLFERIEDSPDLIEVESLREFVDGMKACVKDDPELFEYLTDIYQIEGLLAVCQSIFDYLLTCNNRKIDDIIRSISDQNYDFSFLSYALNKKRVQFIDQNCGGPNTGTRLESIKSEFCGGEIKNAIDLLLEQNTTVMKLRGGAEWIRYEAGKLNVKYPYEKATLPKSDEIGTLWRNSYFFNSFKSIMKVLNDNINGAAA